MDLSEEEKQLIRDALYSVAEKYVELARSKLKFDGHPKKGYDLLVNHYFQKADMLTNAARKLDRRSVRQ